MKDTTLRAGDLVKFHPDPSLSPRDPSIEGMIGIVTSVSHDMWEDPTVIVLWADGVTTDSHLQDLTPLDHVRDREPIV